MAVGSGSPPFVQPLLRGMGRPKNIDIAEVAKIVNGSLQLPTDADIKRFKKPWNIWAEVMRWLQERGFAPGTYRLYAGQTLVTRLILGCRGEQHQLFIWSGYEDRLDIDNCPCGLWDSHQHKIIGYGLVVAPR